MIIVDTHCHVSPYWYEPIESLLYHMDHNEVERAALIQYMGQYDNDYQAECVKRYPGRFVSVVLVDTSVPNAPQRLEQLADQGAAGIRLMASTRSPGDDPFAIWRKAESLGLPVSCGGQNSAFASDEFADLVQALPNLSIIIEHLGSVNKPADDLSPHQLRQKVFGLARFPNTFIKIHGLGEFCRRNTPVTQSFPFETPVPPLLTLAYEAFGAARMMWGSDYPPVSGREGYRNSLQMPMAQLSHLSEAEKEMIFAGTALQVFDF